MLAKFSVEGFKGFDKKIVLDLSTHKDYQFNNNMIKNNLINKAIIYGKNGTGKTNIGYALFDLVFHLTDTDLNMLSIINKNYLNLNNNYECATFHYEFKFDNDILTYDYKKENCKKLVFEELFINGESVLKYDYQKFDPNLIKIDAAKNLNWENIDNNQFNNYNMSILKYIFNNTFLSDDNILYKFREFVNGMLWFRDVEQNSFIGFRTTGDSLDNLIVENNKLDDFQLYLKKHGLNYHLEVLTDSNNDNNNRIYVNFGEKRVLFNDIISSGTKSLWLYYCWHIFFDKITFLFMDEFDSKYHFELAANIVEELKNNNKIQSILTSHNTYLMSNRLTRPDCTFILTKNSLKNLSLCSDKELREAHNIEKLYRNGAFTE